MNTDNGALEFDVYFNNEKLKQTSAETENSIKKFTDTAVKGGKDIDDAFKITAENINIQKNVIGQIEAQLADLNIEIAKLPSGSKGQAELKNQAKQLTAELNAEKLALKQLDLQVKSTEEKHVSFRTQIRNAREELVQMEQAGLRGTKAYTEQQKKLGELVDAYGDVQQQAQVLANDEKIFRGIISTVSGVTGAFSAAQGAVGLFAGENENLNRIMLKVQSLMAITIGLQQVAEMLNKDSYFSIVILTKAKEMLAVAESKVAVAMGVSTAAARVLMATLTLGLSVAITAIVVAFSKFESKASEARKEAKAFNDAVADAAFKPIAAIEQLSAEYKALGQNIKEKEKFIEDNADKFKDLGISVTSVNDAENVLIGNKDRFIEAMIFRAKAMASVEMASEKYKEALKKQMELEKEPKKVTTFVSTDQYGKKVTFEQENSKYNKLQESKEKLETEADNMMKMSVEFTEKEKEILKSIGVSSNQIVEGSIAALESSISRLKDKYKNASNDTERSKLEKQIKQQEKLLERMDKLSQKEKKDDSVEKANKKIIDDFEASMNEEIKMADSVLEVLAIIEKRKKELTGDGSQVDKGKKEAIAKAESDTRIRLNEETEQLLEDYASFLDRKLMLQKQYNDDMMLLQMQLSKEQSDEQKKSVTDAMAKRTEKFKKDNKTSGDTEYDGLIEQYRNYEEKKQAIIEDYDEKRKKASEFGNAELVKRLNEQQAKELSQLGTDELVNSDDWKKLFGQLDRLTVDELIKLKAKIEAGFQGLDLTPEDLAAVREKIEQVTGEIQKKNPFKALSESIANYKKDQSNVNLKQLASDLSASIDLIKGSFDAVVSGLQTMGVNMDENTQRILNDIGNIIAGASQIAEGIATGNPLAIIQGSIQLISSGIDLIAGGKDMKLQKSIEEHSKSVERLKKSYEDLEKAIDKALGDDRYKSQRQLIANLQQQQKEYQQMIKAEQDKKKTDDSKVSEYQDAIKDNYSKIGDTINQLREEILNGSVSSIANDLGDAFIEAFSAGENAAEAWGKKVDDIVGNIVRKMLIQKIVEEPVGKVINNYLSKWVDENGNFIGFDAVMTSAEQMGKELSALGPGLAEIMNSLPDDIKKYLIGDGESSAMSGSIQGMSEQSADILTGQVNAIRINQIESLNVMRQQLIQLSEIAKNTSYNKFLKNIDEKLGAMSQDSLRSQGLG